LFPVLTPLAVDPAHPFPYVSNLAISLGVLVRNPLTMEQRFARVKVPTLIKRFYQVTEGRFVPVEDVIAAHIGELFEGMTIVHVTTFRVTRNADLTLESEDADDLLAAVEMELRRRRFGRAVRLEVDDDIDPSVLSMLLEELELENTDVSRHRAPLATSSLWEIHAAVDNPALKEIIKKSTLICLQESSGNYRVTAVDIRLIDFFKKSSIACIQGGFTITTEGDRYDNHTYTMEFTYKNDGFYMTKKIVESEFEDQPIENIKINDKSVPLKGFSIYTYFYKYMIERDARQKKMYPDG
jgi:hypothetical protein